MNYQRIYDQIIDRAKERTLEGYKEKHHIIPKCMGGSNEKQNLVELTAREHFICHWLLCRVYPENKKLGHAFWFMSKQNSPTQQRDYIVSSRTYAEAVSNLRFTEEHKQKIRTAQLGNTNNSSRVFKGMKSDITQEGRSTLAEARKKDQTGKTGLQAKAAKGPYTVILESGQKHTAGSYPELSKLTGIPYSTLQCRLNHKEGVVERGWLIRRGE
jgi:hypothetical protein